MFKDKWLLLATSWMALAGCSKGPEKVVESYIKASTWEERLQYVRNPNAVRPRMAEYYRSRSLGPKSYQSIQLIDAEAGATDEWRVVKVVYGMRKTILGSEWEDAVFFPVQMIGREYKVDWDAAVGYNPLSFEALKAQRPSSSIKLRVLARLDNYYNYDFLGLRNQYWSIAILSQGEVIPSLYAYMGKSTPDGDRLYSLLKDGEYHDIIGVFRFARDPAGNVMFFEKYLQSGWIEQ